METVAQIDQQLLALANERDAAVVNYKQQIAALRQQREAAIAQGKVAAMTDVERESLRQALIQTAAPVVAASQPQVQQPGGTN